MLRLQLGSVNRCLSLLAARKKINFHDKLFYPVMLEQHMTMRIHVVRGGLGRCQHLLLRPPPPGRLRKSEVVLWRHVSYGVDYLRTQASFTT